MRRKILLFSLLLIAVQPAAAAGRPPIVDAVRNGDKAMLRDLIQKKVNINEAEADGTTALHWSSYRDDLESADLLLRAGAKVDAANDLGATPLWTASLNGSTAMTRRLLEAGANPNLALLSGETPVMVAARGGHADVVEHLLSKGADVNARATRGQTALMWAASQKQPNVVKVLLAYRADIHAKSDVWTQVMAVPPHGYRPYNMDVPHGGDTALLFAARVGDLESMKLLVAAGANVNDADAWGVSAMTFAAHSGFTDLVQFLLDSKADPDAAASGFTPLHLAIMHRDEKMASLLLAHGADPNAPLKTWTPTRRNSSDWNFAPELVGATPFWLAARFTQPTVMRLLLKHGADARFVHHGDHMVEATGGTGYQKRSNVTTAVLAALGIGGGLAWVPVDASQREALTLEAVKIAVDAGVDINAANLDGRTALAAAKALGFKSVLQYLTEKGAK